MSQPAPQRRTIRRTHRSRPGRLRAVVRGATAPGRGCAERRRGAARRHRLRPVRLLRLDHRHAQHRRARRRRTAVHQLPRHAAVLADPGIAAHRALAARRRDAVDRQLPHRLPPSARPHLRSRGHRGRGLAGRGLRHVLHAASGTWRRWSSARRPARSTSGRWGAGSTGSTASWKARPTSSIPIWCATTTRSSHRVGPRTATTSARTSSISCCG